jgi:hypothetical protein
MPTRILRVFFALSILSTAASKPTLADLRFLAGAWTGAAGGTIVEEHWSTASNHTMIAMYREMEKDHTTFYEFLVLSDEDGKVVLRMKHFDKNLTGWEEKDQSVLFDATEISTNRVLFVSRNRERPTTLEYKLSAPGKLDGVLTRVRDGKTFRDEFHYKLHGPR